jgi:hypothetical protein
VQTASFSNLPELAFALPLKCTHHLLHHLDIMATNPGSQTLQKNLQQGRPAMQFTWQSLATLNIKEHLFEEDGGKLAIQRRFESKIDAEAEPAAGRSWPRCKLPPAFKSPNTPLCLSCSLRIVLH